MNNTAKNYWTREDAFVYYLAVKIKPSLGRHGRNGKKNRSN